VGKNEIKSQVRDSASPGLELAGERDYSRDNLIGKGGI
jgi:hypothetical protein